MARPLQNRQHLIQQLNVYISAGTSLFQGESSTHDDLQPIAVKDNITTKDYPTTCASRILRGHRSPFESSVTEQLRKNLFEVKAKTNLDEFGMGSHSMNSSYGPVRNYFKEYSAGGSSGGSAVAVARGQFKAALGTDTGGSVRLPAAYTGVIGFKPSYGLVSRFGVIPYANSMDTVGFLTQRANIAMKMLWLTRVHDPRDPTSLSTKAWNRIHTKANSNLKLTESSKDWSSLRVGVPLDYNIVELHPGVRLAWERALKLFQDRGCTIVPVSLPNTKHALSAYYVLAAAEAASNLAKYDGVRYGSRLDSSDGIGDVLYSETRGTGLGGEVKRRILLGSYTLSSEAVDNYFLKAQKVRRLVQRDFDRVFAMENPLRPPEQFDLGDMEESVELDNKLGPPQVDVIICPTAPTPPPRLNQVLEQTPVQTYMNDVFTVPASLAGLPAVSVPLPLPWEFSDMGAPNWTGIQIIGQYSNDFKVLLVAESLENLIGAEGYIWGHPPPNHPLPHSTNVNAFNSAFMRLLKEGETALPLLKVQELQDAIDSGLPPSDKELQMWLKDRTPLPLNIDAEEKMTPFKIVEDGTQANDIRLLVPKTEVLKIREGDTQYLHSIPADLEEVPCAEHLFDRFDRSSGHWSDTASTTALEKKADVENGAKILLEESQ